MSLLILAFHLIITGIFFKRGRDFKDFFNLNSQGQGFMFKTGLYCLGFNHECVLVCCFACYALSVVTRVLWSAWFLGRLNWERNSRCHLMGRFPISRTIQSGMHVLYNWPVVFQKPFFISSNILSKHGLRYNRIGFNRVVVNLSLGMLGRRGSINKCLLFCQDLITCEITSSILDMVTVKVTGTLWIWNFILEHKVPKGWFNLFNYIVQDLGNSFRSKYKNQLPGGFVR